MPSLSKTRSRGNVPGYPRLLGGRLCLDFVNTVEGRAGDAPVNVLTDYEQLVRWGYHAGALDRATSGGLTDLAEREASRAAAALGRAIDLREDMYAVLSLQATNREPSGDLPGSLQGAIHRAVGRACLLPSSSQYGWQLNTPHLDLLSDLVALDLLGILTSSDLNRVKRCPGCDDCGWLFLDASKNGSRRWCSMEGCGSRAKMRRQYRRQHGRTLQ